MAKFNASEMSSALRGFTLWLLDEGPTLISIFLVLLLMSTIMALGLFDPVIGQVPWEFLTGDAGAAWLISLATTAGVMLPIVVATKMLAIGDEKRPWKTTWKKRPWVAIICLLVLGIGINFFDLYFDGLALDVYRFGKFIDANTEIEDEAIRQGHLMGRWLIRVLSLGGDASSAALLGLFPLLKTVIASALNTGQHEEHGDESLYASIPVSAYSTPMASEDADEAIMTTRTRFDRPAPVPITSEHVPQELSHPPQGWTVRPYKAQPGKYLVAHAGGGPEVWSPGDPSPWN